MQVALCIVQVGGRDLAEYSRVPIAFEVKSMFRVEDRGGLEGLTLREEAVAEPYIKDYDGYDEGGPERWLGRFDVANWGLFIGYEKGSPACAAAVAYDTPGVHMLGGRRDLAVLWDIRVVSGLRHSGMGTAIFTHAAEWARNQGARQMKIETQNINVPACRFYLRMGCRLGEINLHAYAADPRLAHEAMLV
jgi:GNAT superfamily N-acetyltransferase